jgi:hypothetical protein
MGDFDKNLKKSLKKFSYGDRPYLARVLGDRRTYPDRTAYLEVRYYMRMGRRVSTNYSFAEVSIGEM